MFVALGRTISQLINEFVKTPIRQVRPEACALLEMCGSHSWPSGHSQYLFFFAISFTLLTNKGIGFWIAKNRLTANFLPWSLAVLTMYSRVYLGYHTVAQVFAGAPLGLFVGVWWFWVANSVLCRCFPAIEESAFGRKEILYKDTSHIDNALKFEYDNARAARKANDAGCKSD